MTQFTAPNGRLLVDNIKTWATELGFAAVGIADIHLDAAEQRLREWLARGFAGELGYMSAHGSKRSRPAELVPNTVSIIAARMDYRFEDRETTEGALADSTRGYVARYALGRDYHKFMRARLRRLALRIEREIGTFGHRAFVDSAPVMEKPIAVRAGLGWLGKHTNVLNRHAGSWFLLGEIYTDLPLPTDEPESDHCGSCRACLDACPTYAIVAPYLLDARRCISYLTIESRGPIPEALRPAIGNRIFGCDDCQLVCPWNKFSPRSREPEFSPRHDLDGARLVDLFSWSEKEWDQKTRGSALRRTGYRGWLRNLAVALGNAPASKEVRAALASRASHADPMVAEHVAWARRRHEP